MPDSQAKMSRSDAPPADRLALGRHIHVAKYDDNGVLLDECAKCGLDLRNEIHFLSAEVSNA